MKLKGTLVLCAGLALGGLASQNLPAEEAKSGASTEVAASPEQAVDRLIPRLGATNVGERYDAQMELQAMALKSTRPGAESERKRMAQILASKAVNPNVAYAARVWFVRQLEYVGDASSVTELEPLLNGSDGELKEAARRALEKNPSPAATSVLRDALEKGGDAKWKIGLIQSLGERRDAKVVALIKPCLADPQTGAAAAGALAKIANADSVNVLWEACNGGDSVAAEALVFAGARLIKDGESGKAEKIFLRLYEMGNGQPSAAPVLKDRATANRVRAAALVGLAKANPKEARKYIVAELEGNDPRMQYAAVTAAALAYGKEKLSGELAGLLPKSPSTAKIYILRQLDPSAESQVIALTEDPDENVKAAAFETLGRIGGVSCVPVLIKTAAGSSPEQKPAAAALARLSASGVDGAIEKLAQQGDSNIRVVAIETLAERHDRGALPALIEYASDPDQKVSAAACAAVGKLGADQEFDAVARLAMTGKISGADAALQSVAGRVKDKAAAAKKLASLVPADQPEQATFLFETLTALGGADGLAVITNSIASSNEQIKDAAIRALAGWPDFAATGPLLVIAADSNAKRVHQVLAVQGVVRLVKSSENERVEARLSAAMLAMSAATRDQDKKLVLSAFAAIPDKKAADAIKPYLSDAKFEPEAGMAGVALAESLRKTDKPAAKDLAQAVKGANVSDELTRKAQAVIGKN